MNNVSWRCWSIDSSCKLDAILHKPNRFWRYLGVGFNLFVKLKRVFHRNIVAHVGELPQLEFLVDIVNPLKLGVQILEP